MCVAVLKPKNSKIDDKTMEKCWETNPDGGGFMYVNDNKIIIRKEVDSFEKYISMYRKHERLVDTDFILHFRIATSGLIDVANTHPHKVNDDVYMVHNGVIDRCSVADSEISDTMKFCKFISNLPNNFTGNKSMIELITGYIGTDKMIFLNRNGDIKIVNENKGIWKDGNWYSNGNWDYTRKKWYQRQTELNNRIMENVELHRGGRWDTSEEYGIIENDIDNDGINRCTDCDEVIGKYEDHDYDGRCYSCWRLISETARYYGDF